MPTTRQSSTPPTQRTGRQPTPRPSRRRIAGERRPPDSPSSTPGAASPPTNPLTSTAPGPRPTTAGRAGPERPGRLLVVVAVLLLVAVAAMVTVVVRDRLQAAERADALDSALSAAPARAEEAAKALLSYGHDTIDADIARATPFLTTEYAEEYTTTMREVVADPAQQTKATVQAKVLSSGVVDAGPERADVLVFVNQVTESTNSEQPRTALNRAILTMVERDGRWVVSDLKGL